VITGGTELKIVPDRCTVEFEIRNLPCDSPDEILHWIEDAAARLVATARASFPGADIRIEATNAYPGLETSPDEFITLEQMRRCDAMMDRLLEKLT